MSDGLGLGYSSFGGFGIGSSVTSAENFGSTAGMGFGIGGSNGTGSVNGTVGVDGKVEPDARHGGKQSARPAKSVSIRTVRMRWYHLSPHRT